MFIMPDVLRTQTAPTGTNGTGIPGEAGARKIMLVTDAWEPQVNGVVRTLTRLVTELRAIGCEVGPRNRSTAPLPAKKVSLMIFFGPLPTVSNSIGMVSFTRDSE